MQPHGQQPARLFHPWDFPGKNTGVGCHCLLQCMKVKSESEVAQSRPTPSNPMDCSPPGSSVHGISQARVLESGAIAFSRGSSRNQGSSPRLLHLVHWQVGSLSLNQRLWWGWCIAVGETKGRKSTNQAIQQWGRSSLLLPEILDLFQFGFQLAAK